MLKSSASSPVAARKVLLDQPLKHFVPLKSKQNRLKSEQKHVVVWTDQSDKDDHYLIPISKRKAPLLIDNELKQNGKSLVARREEDPFFSGSSKLNGTIHPLDESNLRRVSKSPSIASFDDVFEKKVS
jgi:hypothetical protein